MLSQEARENLICYIYDEYKTAHGIRPRWMDFDAMSDQELEDLADQVERDCIEAAEHEARIAADAIVEFEKLITSTIQLGAHDRQEALRWICQRESFYSPQDVEHFVWEHGFLFTDYGRKLTKELEDLVEYEDYVPQSLVFEEAYDYAY